MAGAPALPRAAVLTYHKLHDDDGPRALSVRRDRFQSQMHELARRALRVVRLSDLVDQLERGDLPADMVALTFDDGYTPSCRAAVEILGRLGLPATFFIVSGPLDENAVFWWDVVDVIFDGDRPLPPTLDLDLPHGRLHVAVEGQREAAHNRVRGLCYTMNAQPRADLIEAVVRWAGSPSVDSEQPMTGDELRSFAATPGVEIGAHSRHHVWLPAQPAEIVRAEAEHSKNRLEELLGRGVAAFSYPYGAWDPPSAAAIRATGFRYAVTTESRPVTARDDRYALPRFVVDDLDQAAFRAFLDDIFGEAD